MWRTASLTALILLAAASCEKSKSATAGPDGGAALPTKETGERLEKIRAALAYRRAAEQRGQLRWHEDEGGRAAALEAMYLQGSEDLGELSLIRVGPGRVRGSVSILARGSGPAAKCKLTFLIAGETLKVRAQFARNAEAPEGLRVEVDRLAFELDVDVLQRLAATPDSGGSACGLSFSFTRAQRDRLDRTVALFTQRTVDDAALEAAQQSWDADRLPGEDGGFRDLGVEIGQPQAATDATE